MSFSLKSPSAKVRRGHTQPQPRTLQTIKLSIRGVLSFPYRICNPPQPSVGQVRSWGVTPLFEVRLEDILSKKHLPPLGLKDFEEWLTYVENQPENLYFILWLREYTENYNIWILQSKPNIKIRHHDGWQPQTSTSLAMSYARAKQTFFTPSSPYELDVPSDILTTFYSPASSPHLDPVLFDEVASAVRVMLEESLKRFVVAQYTNTGGPRTLCGIIGGISCLLLGSIAPLAVNFSDGKCRWLRLLAMPGMFFGIMILLASLHGVCVMVYVFGDLRQLRKFELARPSISRPQNVSARPAISAPEQLQPPRFASHLPSLTLPKAPSPALLQTPSSSRPISADSSRYLSSEYTHSSTSRPTSSDSEHSIEISPAYYDESAKHSQEFDTCVFSTYNRITKRASANEEDYFPPTAPFIHSYDSLCDPEYFGQYLNANGEIRVPRHPIGAFDFDLLPRRSSDRSRQDSEPRPSLQGRLSMSGIITTAKGGIGRLQDKCPDSDVEKGAVSSRSMLDPVARRKAQYKVIRAVPAFGSPFTRVLNPVVTRAQWEIVVRSGALALLICWCILGSLLAIPER